MRTIKRALDPDGLSQPRQGAVRCLAGRPVRTGCPGRAAPWSAAGAAVRGPAPPGAGAIRPGWSASARLTAPTPPPPPGVPVRRRLQQHHRGRRLDRGAVEPAPERLRRQDGRHAVMDRGEVAVGGHGDDGGGVDLLAVRPAPGLPQAGEGQRLAVARPQKIGLPAACPGAAIHRSRRPAPGSAAAAPRCGTPPCRAGFRRGR